MQSVCGRDPISGDVLHVDIEQGRIAAVRASDSTSEVWLSPGFVDLQVNGYAGLDLNAPACTAEVVATLVRVLAARGTTTFLPTIITNSASAVAHTLTAIREARYLDTLSRRAIPCIHMEGPFLSPETGYRGAHDAKYITAPSLDLIDEWQRLSENLIGLVTLSPHWPNAASFIRELRHRGIVVALGHTHADAQQIQEAIEAGATVSTHLGNALPAEIPRHRNSLWPQLAADQLTATLIADGFHLPNDLLRLAVRAKGKERCILISDSVALAGSAPGEYQSHIGQQVTVREDGSIRLPGSELLAGSGISLQEAVSYAASVEGIGLGAATLMATVNPGKIIGRDYRISVGKPANLLLFQWQPGVRRMYLERVYVAGQTIFPSA